MARAKCFVEGPRRLQRDLFCLTDVSKNARGMLVPLEAEIQSCRDCKTLKTAHTLKVELIGHECDDHQAQPLNGSLFTRRFVPAFKDGDAGSRGVHTGRFIWNGEAGIQVRGTMNGITNAGTHRRPVFDDCQQCREPGVIEGRLCGVVRRAQDQALIGCDVTALYKFTFDPTEEGGEGSVKGIIEGSLVCHCNPAG